MHIMSIGLFLLLLFLEFLLDDLLYLAELDELVDGLEGDSGLICYLFVKDHLVHVITRDGPHDVFVLFVVPHHLVLLQLPLVQLVKQSKGARLVVLFLLLRLLLLFRLADQQNLLRLLLSLLLGVALGLDVKIIWVPQILRNVLGLLRLFRENPFNVQLWRQKLELVSWACGEAGQDVRVSEGVHANKYN